MRCLSKDREQCELSDIPSSHRTRFLVPAGTYLCIAIGQIRPLHITSCVSWASILAAAVNTDNALQLRTYAVPSTSPPRSAPAILAVCIAPSQKKDICCDRCSFYGRQSHFCQRPPFRNLPDDFFSQGARVCGFYLKELESSNSKAQAVSFLVFIRMAWQSIDAPRLRPVRVISI